MYPVSKKFRNEQLIKHNYITLQYNEKAEQARWVYYKLDNSMLRNIAKRKEVSFSEDPLVKTGSATNIDYKDSRYDKGHLCPANDMEFSKTALKECFYLSNVAPQLHSVNAGDWRQIEAAIHRWANDDTLIVITGTIYTDKSKRIGNNDVVVPDKFWKCIYSIKRQSCIAFVVPNTKTNKDLRSYVVSVDELEHITELDFWSDADDYWEAYEEQKLNIGTFFEY